MVEINRTKYKIDKNNYHSSINKKRKIILAGSERKENYHIIRLQNKEYGNSKKWCTYTIDRQGNVYEHYNPKYYTDFMDDKDVDKESISIVLENMGALYYDAETDSYRDVIYNIPCEGIVYEKRWRKFIYWEKYTQEQLISTVELCEFLCEKFNIESFFIGDNVYFNYTKKFSGIVTRANFSEEYCDLNPSFDFDKFIHLLERGDESDEL